MFYRFSFTTYVLSTFYIPSIVLGTGDWTVSRTRFWRYLLFPELPCLGLGMGGRTPHHTSVPCLIGPLSPQMPLLFPIPSLLLHSSCLVNLFLVNFLLCICLSVPTVFVHSPEGFVPSFMPSMHGDIFPHLSHRVLSAMVFFLSPTFIREQKLFSLLLRQTFFFF